MGKLIGWFTALWPKLPEFTQRAISIAIAVAIVLLPTIFLLYTLRDGSLQQRMGMMPTQDGIDARFAEQAKRDSLANAVAIQSLEDFKQDVQHLEDSAREHYLDPMVAVLQDLQSRMQTVEDKVGITNRTLDRIDNHAQEQNRNLRHIMEADDTRTNIDELIRAMESRIMERMDEQDQRIEDLKRNKTSKQRF